MKKLLLGGLLLSSVGMGLVSCQKDSPDTNSAGMPKKVTTLSGTNNGILKTEERSYKWIGSKLDCSNPGTGCKVAASYQIDGSSIALFPLQVMKLMEYSGSNLNQYFVDSDLSYEFPALYEGDTLQEIQSGEIKLDFEFPYLKVLNQAGGIIKIYNYETTLSDTTVLSYFQAATAFNKQLSLATDGSNVWECINPGTNCKTTSFNFDENWLASHSEYIGSLSNVQITATSINETSNVKQVLFTAGSGDQYGIQYEQ